MSKTTFISNITARLTGENIDAFSAKIARKCISALEGQIAALKGVKVDQENEVEEAEEALQNAVYPTSIPAKSEDYCREILRAQSNLDDAKANLEATETSIEYFSNLLKDQEEPAQESNN
jgi:hypothetical protein